MPARKRNKSDLASLEQSFIRQSNEIIQEANYELKESREQRILLYLLSQINPEDTEFHPITMNRSEFARIAGINATGGSYTAAIDSAIARLYDANIYFRGSRWIPKADGSGEKMMKWITAPEKNHRGQYVLQISPDMAPYLLELRKNYTTLELAWMIQLRGTYSLRAYQYLKSRHYDKLHPYTFKISVDNLRERLGATSYPRWRDFQKRALEPAMKEITEKTDMNAWYKPIMAKNKITELEITVATKDNMQRLNLLAAIETDFAEDQVSLWGGNGNV